MFPILVFSILFGYILKHTQGDPVNTSSEHKLVNHNILGICIFPCTAAGSFYSFFFSFRGKLYIVGHSPKHVGIRQFSNYKYVSFIISNRESESDLTWGQNCDL